MEKYLSVMSRKTKLKCVGVIGLAFIGSLLASLWPVRLGELYNGISDGAIGTLAQGGVGHCPVRPDLPGGGVDRHRPACLTGDYQGVLCREPERALGYTISEGAANLSGGQRQRLSLARAFLRRPKLYIFDESTANLDEQTAAAVLTNLERHAAADGAGILYISHDQNVVDRCDQVIVLANSIASHSPGPEKAAPGCACTLPS